MRPKSQRSQRVFPKRITRCHVMIFPGYVTVPRNTDCTRYRRFGLGREALILMEAGGGGRWFRVWEPRHRFAESQYQEYDNEMANNWLCENGYKYTAEQAMRLLIANRPKGDSKAG